MRKSFGILLAGVLLTVINAGSEEATFQQHPVNPGSPWPAVDALGRVLPMAEEVGEVREDRFVGIFYFLWLGQHNVVETGPYDVTKIFAADPDAMSKPDSPLWGPIGQMHYWGESLYGYYLSNDPWVIRRHASLLADAGIDTLIFDTTNRVTYKENYLQLCEVFLQIRKEGGRTPHITFMTNTKAGETAQELYDDLYSQEKYKELFFQWRGKPLLICDPEKASEELRVFFTLRKAHWPFEMVNTKNAWHWEATYPQPYGYTDDPEVPEQVNVSVAQNLRVADGKVTNMSDGNARSRNFHDGKIDTSPNAILHGHNFAEQWTRAWELAPPFVMVTGWNEWVAGRWQRENQPIVFVDNFSHECSRDIEPMKGGHNDNYYYQLIAGVRRYKGVPPIPVASEVKTIDRQGEFTQWREVLPVFTDAHNETQPRNFAGVAKLHYTNATGRNEFVLAKIARDADNIYAYIECQNPISPWTDPGWMWLLIDVDQDPGTGWQGYDFIVNHSVNSATATTLKKHVGDTAAWRWEAVTDLTYRVEGNQLHLTIPRDVLGLAEKDAFTLDFKWLDNPQRPGDIMDVYLSGDAAPLGRFNYRYQVK